MPNVLHYENLRLYLRIGLKWKKINTSHISIQSITLVKDICWIQHTKNNRSRKNGDKYGKALYKLMSNVAYHKTMENLRNRIAWKLVSNKKYYAKWTSKPSYMLQKLFDNDLVAIRKNKVILTLNKPAYVGMYILELM